MRVNQVVGVMLMLPFITSVAWFMYHDPILRGALLVAGILVSFFVGCALIDRE
jgi:hypothetical protein